MNLFKWHHGTLTSSLTAVAGTQCLSPGTGWSLSCRLVLEHSVLRETAGIDAVLHLISSSTQSVITCQDESEMVNEHEQPSKKKINTTLHRTHHQVWRAVSVKGFRNLKKRWVDE